jgi:PQQ-like domain
LRGAVLAASILLAACGGGSSADTSAADGARAAQSTHAEQSTRAAQSARAAQSSQGGASRSIPSGDWTRFDYDAKRSGVGPASTGITARNLASLQRRRVHLDGTVDSSPIELHAIAVGGRKRDVIVVTTTYGKTIALDAATGHKLWEFVPAEIHDYEGSSQFTTATPIADPNRRFVYATSPDGLVRKLVLATGREVRSGGWPARMTFDPTHEKLAAALNLTGGSVVVTTGGYFGDAPPYQGHVVLIHRSSGRIVRVWNSLCSNQRHLIDPPRSCPASDSAIWARAGAVIDDTRRILVATGNASFNGSTNWGDSVLELSPDASRLLQNWTPANQAELNVTDRDLGSTAPALLPPIPGFRLAVQGGKEGTLALLDLNRLNGSGGASRRTGGELQRIAAPGSAPVFTAPAVWTHAGRTLLFVATESGTTAYLLHRGRRPGLSVAAANSTAGTSPVIAGGLLYVYDQVDGAVNVYEPATLRLLISLPAATGHWNSPIVVGGRVVVPEGNANDQKTSGTLDIYHLPGR